MAASIVYCIIPVHNRLVFTKRCLEYLNAQGYSNLQIVIVDDGSTDGTGEYLEQHKQENLTVLKGDGSLWWGGAMHMAIELVMSAVEDECYLLMLNNDMRIKDDYVSNLVSMSVNNNNAVVGSVQCNEETDEAVGYGYDIDFWGMRFNALDNIEITENVSALPGRGVLFPLSAMRYSGNVNAKLFRHYYGDLEFTCRVQENGWKIVICEDAPVFTSQTGSDEIIRSSGVIARYFSLRSKDNLIQRLIFFSVRGPWLLRLTALPRYMILGSWRLLKRKPWEWLTRSR